jgi:hypothetical protein
VIEEQAILLDGRVRQNPAQPSVPNLVLDQRLEDVGDPAPGATKRKPMQL